MNRMRRLVLCAVIFSCLLLGGAAVGRAAGPRGLTARAVSARAIRLQGVSGVRAPLDVRGSVGVSGVRAPLDVRGKWREMGSERH